MFGPATMDDEMPTVQERPTDGSSTGRGEKFSLEPGTTVEYYEIIRELGRGGMGVVYLARDLQLGRRVAIKFVTHRDREDEQRFLLEARATARCHHENIVVIHAVNVRSDGIPYMVLEHLDGVPLDVHLGDAKLPAPKAVEIIMPVVRALVHAHSFGIVHRDLKPSNIFMTRAGTVKVLDFGIAKSLGQVEVVATGGPSYRKREGMDPSDTGLGVEIGTARYMAPEQWGIAEVDARADIWALGVLLFKLVAGTTPFEELKTDELRARAKELDEPVPSVAEYVDGLPPSFVAIVDRCLEKRMERRFASAQELLGALEPLLPGRYGKPLEDDECPYPGLSAFQPRDADRYFGRAQEIRRAMVSLSEHPMVSIVGPSGLGKSSFVRAGVMPALESSGEMWEMIMLRPGRNPLLALANACGRDDTSRHSITREDDVPLDVRIRDQPGRVGAMLRERARLRESRIMIFVDQFEELYTLVADPNERRTFTNCLLAMADDVASPLRVVLSMRSDFLDRVAEHEVFAQEVTRGLLLLPAMDRQALHEALVQPAEIAGFRFESAEMVEGMLDELRSTPGALSLLQFAAARLWSARDIRTKQLTLESYQQMGGVAGTLAEHADSTLKGMSSSARSTARKVFQRLVTPDRTRALVDLSDLEDLSDEPNEVRRVVDQLVQSRLLMTDVRGGGDAVVELVHESLITSWPTLTRWLDETQEDSAFLAQLRDVAKQWEQRNHPQGLLWRGEALDDAKRFMARFRDELSARERRYINAAVHLAQRSAQWRRIMIGGAFFVLIGLVIGAAIALVEIQAAEQLAREAEVSARSSEEDAKGQAKRARLEAARAQEAERRVSEKLELLRAEERARRAAEALATDAVDNLKVTNEKLASSNSQLQTALARAEDAFKRATEASAAERALRRDMEVLLQREKERVQELEKQRGKIIGDLR